MSGFTSTTPPLVPNRKLPAVIGRAVRLEEHAAGSIGAEGLGRVGGAAGKRASGAAGAVPGHGGDAEGAPRAVRVRLHAAAGSVVAMSLAAGKDLQRSAECSDVERARLGPGFGDHYDAGVRREAVPVNTSSIGSLPGPVWACRRTAETAVPAEFRMNRS